MQLQSSAEDNQIASNKECATDKFPAEIEGSFEVHKYVTLLYAHLSFEYLYLNSSGILHHMRLRVCSIATLTRFTSSGHTKSLSGQITASAAKPPRRWQ